MAIIQVSSYVFDNVSTTAGVIRDQLRVTSTVFDVVIVPISNTQSRAIIFYN